MQRTNLIALPLLLALACLAFASACAENDERDEVTDPFSDEVERGPQLGKIYSAIEEQRERLRNVEGREGILAEDRRYSLFDEELIIRDFFQDRREGFFLDVGCAWPTRSSNTYYLEKHLGWTGIGIDALSEYAPGWQQKRPGSKFFSFLVTDRSGVEETFFKSPNPGLSSTDRDMASGGVFGDALEPEEIRIETITLDDLLHREGVTKIDLLSMDIEGHEPKALAGFDIERFQPELVVIEGKVMPAEDGSDDVHAYFERHGYQLVEKYAPFDTVNRYFRRKD